MITIVEGDLSHWPAVEAFLPLAADEEDYVIHLWRDWIAHPENGLTLVALWENQPVATTYIAYIDTTSCWFQGIRVDPRFQGKGIGQELSHESVRRAKQKGFLVARCGIDGDNHVSQHVTAKAGFQMIRHYSAYLKQQAWEDREVQGVWEPATPDDLDHYVFLQSQADSTQAVGGFLFTFGFYPPVVTDLLREEATPWEEPHFLRYIRDGRPLAYVGAFFGDEGELHGKGYLVQGAIIDPEEDANAIWHDLEHTLRKEEHQGILVWAHTSDPISSMLLARGYQCLEGQGFQIWEQKL